ncbi:MAG: DUF721 domain-containing protein [Armatimonadota bacterium]
MNPLAEVLSGTLRRLELEDAALEAKALMLWPEIVGEQMAKASEARKIQGGALVVTVRNSAWSQEFAFQKSFILRKLRERLGKELVKDLRFVVGAVRGVADPHATMRPPTEEVRRIQLSETENARIRAAAEDTEDPELAQAIRRALTREAQIRQWHLEHGAKACTTCGAAHRSAADVCPACRVK